MGDPLSVAASTAGLLSLGIQVSQSLVSFYLTYQGQDADIERITHKFKSLSDIFQSVGDAIKDRKFRPDEHALVVKIDDLIQDSGEIVIELQEECSKFDKLLPNRLGAAVKTAGRRLTYPFRQSTFAKLDEDIKGIRDNLSLALDILSSRDSSRIQNDIQEIKALLDLVRISQISNAVRDWLKAPDATINYNEACAKRHPATGLWLVKSPTFTMWLEKGNSFLWLNGFAGCGKSVLSSTTIQFAFRHRRSDPRIGIGFFYFTFNDNSKQDVSGMLRALLLQLSNQLDDGQSDLTRLHDKYRDGIPPVPVLMESLRRLVQKFQGVYIVVDALDESPRYDKRENVLNALTDFRNWSLNGLHILVTSRDEIDIREHLDPSSAEDIIMRNAGVDKDIEDYITGYLRQSRVLRKWSAYHLRIKEALTVGAKGV
jgi:ankyrin repeat domain-containing protein 50